MAMRKLIMWNIITLDGCFEGTKNWDLSFHDKVWGPELEKLSLEQLRSADYLVFGRVTYEGMAAYWKTAKNDQGEIARMQCISFLGAQTSAIAISPNSTPDAPSAAPIESSIAVCTIAPSTSAIPK